MSKFRLPRFTAVFLLLLTFTIAVFADTIRLKDGSVVKGKVIGFRDNQFTILIGEGSRQRQMTFYSDEISSIEFDSNSQTAQTTTAVNSQAQTQPTPRVNPNPTPNPAPMPTPRVNPSPTTVPASERPKPIIINSKVAADNTSNGWTNTGWVVRKGQRIRINATGRVSLGSNRFTTPSGIASYSDNNKLIKDRPTGALIAVIGDDNNDFIFVGSAIEFTAVRDGALFLGINEGYLDDNSGSYDAVIQIETSDTSD